MGACNSAAAAAPVSLDIYWDVENCGCARTAKGAAEMHARLMDFVTGAAGAGHSVVEATARGARTLSFYVPARSSAAPRPAALKALDTLGWRHVAVSPKPGAADLAIQRDVDAMLASATPPQLRRRIVVVVSGDSDFAACVVRCRAAGCVVLLAHGAASSETFRGLVPAARRVAWASLVNGDEADPSPPDAADAARDAAAPDAPDAAAPAPDAAAPDDAAAPAARTRRGRRRRRSASEPPLLLDGDSFFDARCGGRRPKAPPPDPDAPDPTYIFQ